MNGTDCIRNISESTPVCSDNNLPRPCAYPFPQDSHWSGGALGYFPSYSLGSAYGAQFLHKMKQDIDIDKLVSENRIDEVTAWLTEKIHKYGMLLTPAQLIDNACGEEFNADYYIEYLTEKYKKIYDLK